MSKISYIKTAKTVRIEREDGDKPYTLFISSNGPLWVWRTNNGKKGQAEGFLGLHQLCDQVGDLSLEEYEFLKKENI